MTEAKQLCRGFFLPYLKQYEIMSCNLICIFCGCCKGRWIVRPWIHFLSAIPLSRGWKLSCWVCKIFKYLPYSPWTSAKNAHRIVPQQTFKVSLNIQFLSKSKIYFHMSVSYHTFWQYEYILPTDTLSYDRPNESHFTVVIKVPVNPSINFVQVTFAISNRGWKENIIKKWSNDSEKNKFTHLYSEKHLLWVALAQTAWVATEGTQKSQDGSSH